MAPANARPAPLPDFLHLLWRSPLIALPFGGFFLLVSGQAWRNFPGYWLAATCFAYGTGVTIWVVKHVLERHVLARAGSGPRASLVLSGVYVFASLVGALGTALLLNSTIMPHFLGDARAMVLLFIYTLLFGLLFVGFALASSFYRQALERAGSERELQLARRIQRSFLLSEFPARARLDVHAVNVSSKEVSGDTYDVVPLPADGLLLAIADVSGKGVPAALLSSMLQASLRTQAASGGSPSNMMRIMNELACQRAVTGQFATAFLATIDEPTLTLRYTNAGHNFPVLLRDGGGRELLETGGLVVGMMEGTRYDEGVIRLVAGDRLVLYTDGVSEAANASGEMFGEERLYALLDGLPRSLSAGEMVNRVLDGVRAFLAGTEAGDDITVMALRVLPPGTAGAPR